jgi:hypothetical protein
MAYNPRQTAAQQQAAVESTSALRPDRANAMIDARVSTAALLQLRAMIDASPRQARAQAIAQLAQAPTANRTGLPDRLKAGIEHLSGTSMDQVGVHYNSSAPAQLNAHAYAQGSEIHLAPGQERHLPHEAWHVVQQAQGRVRPTVQANAVEINDDAGLEREADVMGERALAAGSGSVQRRMLSAIPPPAAVTHQLVRVGVGVGDNDASHIDDHHYDSNKQVTLTGNQHGAGTLADGAKLKHYMVAKNGSIYMLPLRYLNNPGAAPGAAGQFLVNTGTPAERGQQPEAFGGNVDLAHGTSRTESLRASRDATLRREFREESGGRDLGPVGADLDVVRSTYFRHQPGRFEGTASVVNTALPLTSVASADPGAVARGEAEMMGTIAIDTSDIADDAVDEVAAAIVDKITAARDGLLGVAGRNIFEVEGGVLALIVELIAAEVMLDKLVQADDHDEYDNAEYDYDEYYYGEYGDDYEDDFVVN